MKRLLLPLLIATTLAITACDDKDTQAKLQIAEQQISQLKTELAKAEAATPLVQTQYVNVFNKSAEFKRDKPSKEEFSIDESSVHYRVDFLTTNLPWLDNLLYQQALGDLALDDKQKTQEIKALPSEKERFLALMEYLYQQDYQVAKNLEAIGFATYHRLLYLGQRENIATFSLLNYNYSGGAHGMQWTNYINVDVAKKSVLELADVFPQSEQKQLQSLLWEAYKQRNDTRDDNSEALYISAKEFYISEEFYFNENGVNFVYQPYAIGPYAEGEITLTLYWHEIDKLINPDYNWKIPQPEIGY